jgi:hypothetical protein
VSEQRWGWSEALAIAAAPAVAYVLSFAFEAGYAGHFRIPLLLVGVDLRTVLSLGAAFFFAYFVLGVAMIQVAGRLRFTPARAALSIVWWSSLAITIVMATWSFTRNHMLLRVAALAAIGLMGVLPFVLVLLKVFMVRTEGTTWHSRWQAELDRSQPALPPDNVLERTLDALGPQRRYFGRVVTFLAVVAGVRLAGTLAASMETQFLVSDARPPLVVLRRYGDLFVAAPLDTASKQLVPRLVLMRIPTDSATTWRVRWLGRLSTPPPDTLAK